MKRFLFSVWIAFCCFGAYGQKIGVGDDFGYHAQMVRQIINMDSSKIVERYRDNIYALNDFKNDSIVVTCNAYQSFLNINEYAFYDDYTLHIFAAANNQTELNSLNYSNNVLTVLSGANTQPCNSLNHSKIDVITNSYNHLYDCSTSWGAADVTKKVFGLIDTFLTLNQRFPFAIETKAILINSASSNHFINLPEANKNVLNTFVDSLHFGQSNVFNVPVNSFYDSVKITLYYHKLNDDSLTINGIGKANIEQRTYYNVSNNIGINTTFVNGDSLRFETSIKDTLTYVVSFVRTDKDSVKFLDSFRGDLDGLIAIRGNDTSIVYSNIVRVAKNRKVSLNKLSISSYTSNIGDTSFFYTQNSFIDTTYFQNVIKYALSWRYYETQNQLPVELSSFGATQINNTIQLDFTTQSEINNHYFIIQRSIDGLQWTSIGTVEGNGTTYTPTTYQYIDEAPIHGLNYYRIQQVDYDGTNDLSEVITIQFKIPNVADCRYYRLNGSIIYDTNAIKGFYLKKCGDIVTKHYQF